VLKTRCRVIRSFPHFEILLLSEIKKELAKSKLAERYYCLVQDKSFQRIRRFAMGTGKIVAAALLAGAVLVGCDSKSNDTTPQTSTPPAQNSNTVTDQVNKAASGVKDAAAGAQQQVADATTAAKDKANDAAASATDTAKTKLAQVTDYIQQKKLDLADSTLKEVEGMKDKLPADLQTQVTALRTQIDAAKSSLGDAASKLPSLGKYD